MKLIVKRLQGGECTIEVQPSTYISEIKREVAQQLKIPIDKQKLLFLGRTLVDEHTVNKYPTIKDGSKLNLIVKKPESLYDVTLKSFKQAGMTEAEAMDTTKKFLAAIEQDIYKLSLDDIERLASDCLELESHKQAPMEAEEINM